MKYILDNFIISTVKKKNWVQNHFIMPHMIIHFVRTQNFPKN